MVQDVSTEGAGHRGHGADGRISLITLALTLTAMTLMLAEILTEVICTLQMGGRHDRALWNRPFAELRPIAPRPRHCDADHAAVADDESVNKRASGSIELAAVRFE